MKKYFKNSNFTWLFLGHMGRLGLAILWALLLFYDGYNGILLPIFMLSVGIALISYLSFGDKNKVKPSNQVGDRNYNSGPRDNYLGVFFLSEESK